MPVAAAQLTAQHMFRAELRRAQRDDVYFRTRMAVGTRPAVEAQLVNISPYGFMARLRDDATQGDTVRVWLPGDEVVSATVVWSLGGRAGAEFAEPIGVETYRDLVARIADAPSSWELS